MSNRSLFCLTAAIALVVMLNAPVAAQSSYTIQEVPIHAGTWIGGGLGINSSGRVCGWTAFGDRTYYHGFVWTPGAALSDLPTLGGKASYAAGLDDAGNAVGWAQTKQGSYRAVQWKDGRVIDLTGKNGSQAYATNNAGQVVGYAQISRAVRAFAWRNGAYVTLDGTSALDINEGGRIVGHDGDIAVLWTPDIANGTKFTRTVISGSGWSRATGLNDSQPGRGVQVVGWSSFVAGTNRPIHAFLWSEGALLNIHPAARTASEAYGINNNGVIVGEASGFADGDHAFRWTISLDGIITSADLNDLNGDGQYDFPDWLLRDAYAINDAGQITGSGYYRGVERAFLLTPVTP